MSKYLIHTKSPKRRAHIWNGQDTSCRMASTGGLILDKYVVLDDADGREICQMCKNAIVKSDAIGSVDTRSFGLLSCLF